MRDAARPSSCVVSVPRAPASARPIHIVAFGDSLTSGWLVPRQPSLSGAVAGALRNKGYDVMVKNAGIPGDTAKNALRRFDTAIDPDTDICIVEFGINDRRTGASLKTVHARIDETGARLARAPHRGAGARPRRPQISTSSPPPTARCRSTSRCRRTNIAPATAPISTRRATPCWSTRMLPQVEALDSAAARRRASAEPRFSAQPPMEIPA